MKAILGFRYNSNPGCKRHKWLVFNLLRIVACSITLLTIGYISVDWDTTVLFSAWLEKL